MASEKQSAKRAELRRILDLLWKKYERTIWDAPRNAPDGIAIRRDLTEQRIEIERHALFIYLNND